MISTKEQLLGTLEKIRGLPVLVIGDIILDRYIWGAVDRVSPEAPVPVVDVKKVEDRLGGAANVVRSLCNLGAKVSLCGFIGDDEEGQTVLKYLESQGVQREGVMVDRSRPTSLKTRIIAQRQQMLRIDREQKIVQATSLREGFAAVVDAHIDAHKLIIISDYGKGAISEPVMRKLHEADKANRIGMKSRPLVVDPHPASYQIYGRISVVKPNRKEAEVASGTKITDKESAFEAARILMKRWQCDMVMITLGPDGLIIEVAGQEKGIYLETVAQEVFDVSGAGDAATALFGGSIAVGAGPTISGDLANIGAGLVVAEVGTAPVNIARLTKEIERLTQA